MKKIGLILLVILILSGCTSEKKILLINTDGNNQSDTNIGLVDLNDGETTYSGFAGKFLKVKATQDGWEWGDANGGSGNDTNCAITGSCPNVAYENTDVNFSDINGETLIAQQPGQLKFTYGANNKLGEIPFPTGCTEVFGVSGFPNTGQAFCASPFVGTTLQVLGGHMFIAFQAVPYVGSVFMLPMGSLPSITSYPSFAQGGVNGFLTLPDGNFLHELLGPAGWKQVGTYQSAYSNDFLHQSGDFNGNVDFNKNIDVNGFAHFDKNVHIDQNLTVDGNINLGTVSKIKGQYEIMVALNTYSCNSACDDFDVNAGWGTMVCVDASNANTGAHVTCADTAGSKNCLCKN